MSNPPNSGPILETVIDLNAKRRNALPASVFAMPKKRKFPMPDPVHARLAISGATRSENAGNISAAEAATIKAKARKKLNGSAP